MNQSRKLFLITLTLTAGWASAQISQPAFDVASIKLNTRCDTGGPSGGRSTPGRVALDCADLRDLILTAYGIYGDGANAAPGSFRMQVVGGPAWMDSTRYDIVAKPAGNLPHSEMYGPMLQSLLEDRFRLKVHRETKQGPVYLLTLAKDGPKLHSTKEGTCVITDIDHPLERGTRSRGCAERRKSALAVLLLPSISLAPRSGTSAHSSAL
jgi:uncharacterized protein (TIGR03435 family)